VRRAPRRHHARGWVELSALVNDPGFSTQADGLGWYNGAPSALESDCEASFNRAEMIGIVETSQPPVFITLGEPQAHGDTTEVVPFPSFLFPQPVKSKSLCIFNGPTNACCGKAVVP
jgi:hypothetical protein